MSSLLNHIWMGSSLYSQSSQKLWSLICCSSGLLRPHSNVKCTRKRYRQKTRFGSQAHTSLCSQNKCYLHDKISPWNHILILVMIFLKSIYYIIYGLILLSPFAICKYTFKKDIGIKGFILAFIFSVLFMCLIVVLIWFINALILEYKISFLDRDGDGFWSTDEQSTWTEAEKQNMDRYIGDGGRNLFTFFLFPIFSIIYSLIITSIYKLTFMPIKKRFVKQ